MKTLLLASGNPFRFLKVHILNITGLKSTLIAYYIFDTGKPITFTRVNLTSRLFIMFKLIVAEYDRLLRQFFPSYLVAYSLSVSSVMTFIPKS